MILRRSILGGIVALALALGAAEGRTTSRRPIRVGVFDGQGVSAVALQAALEALKVDADLRSTKITGAEIAAGGLDRLDVIVFPGGSGSRQWNDLGATGAELVRRFVLERGKGAIGLCAGAYLLSDTPDYACLRLCPLQAIDREHDERGHGVITFRPTAEGLELFPELGGWESGHVYYYEGPILVPANGPARGATILATMESDVALENAAPSGMTPGRPLFVRASSGKGRVFLSVGHPEVTPGLRWMVARAARWVAGRETVPYTTAVVRPGLRGGDLLFDETLRNEEERLHQTLLFGAPSERPAAIGCLAAMASWDAPFWIRGFLRSDAGEVRVAAARALVDLEWTGAIPDLDPSLATERDRLVRAELALARERLGAMTPASAVRGGRRGRREIAVTIDDLPIVNAGTDDAEGRAAVVRKLTGRLKGERIPAVGFVVGRNAESPDGAFLSNLWLDAGVELGNHTSTHPSLHQVGSKAFEADLAAEDTALRSLLALRGLVPRYFRHPMLHTGRSPALKRKVAAFAASLGYEIAPVTIDNADWIFAKGYSDALRRGDRGAAKRILQAYVPYMESKVDYWERQSKQLLGYEVRQILLFHASALNADAIGDLLAMLRHRGYSFVSLREALADAAYSLPDGYTGGGGISWLHRWAFALGGKGAILPGEPECPRWVMEAAGVDSE
jgi:peptidoglycan/xylan/chitin deacetylase (PgdA/CDA1 family)